MDHFAGKLCFVQCGEAGHWHTPLRGVVDFLGKTADVRRLMRLVYHADGVLCPVTFAMHLSAALELPPGRVARGCVVVAGGREPTQWEMYPGHQFLHTQGALDCCATGGCWKSRCQPVGDGDAKDYDLCVKPVEVPSGLWVPKCMNIIDPARVIRAIELYYEGGALPPVDKQAAVVVPARAAVAAQQVADVHSLVRRGFEIGMVQIESEILALASVVAWLRPRNVLEIGSDLGGTFCIWSQLARGRKISVDIPAGPFGRPEAREARGRMASFASGCHLIDTDSHSPDSLARVRELLAGEALDFLFIDGDHTEAGVRRDWEVYAPLVRPGGLVAFHDVNDTPRHREAGCMVGPFWASLEADKTTISSGADWGGIGLVRLG